MRSKYIINIQDILEHLKSKDTYTIVMMRLSLILEYIIHMIVALQVIQCTWQLLANIHMLTLIITMITIYDIYCLIQSRSITCDSLFGSTMSSLVNSMTKDNLNTNIITYDRNLIITISFMLCYVSKTSLID